ncbi:GNAT family N-acetyltransferase [Vibrio coralliilyticus]|uniref:GNAT family N-acetyltransferase n=1 Tax=Vibrio coralliilyticus TaxID=190893 RepID=UPI000BAC2432|nr:GNAT family N-acetyltransferase [Vibrio coralliilyticus]MCC2520544.1 GNAT family N-acetyltransferase [Vibrio coralliilyticus]NOI27283.1 GNAT family N-acetyltransferase [Vibrio coralliilyticus]NOI46426.1 GNAT family N-acetyltransferase [Vibrio coralliilyticus]NOI74322.1 GNAT family N-acetyltransferase [Vibrio coralliilyticus]NRF29550.1 GNAT family N-acetyltransferase [Vibrio coralliilyticus]
MQPNIETNRLVLRPFRLSDSERVAHLAGEKVIAEMTANIPHPYESNMAVEWIKTHIHHFTEKTAVVFAITIKGCDDIIGAVSLPTLKEGVGILGYWLGTPYWGKGIAFEASQALIDYAKQHLNLVEIEVQHLVHNQRSKSVIEKLGIEYQEDRTVEVHGEKREVCVYRSLV